MESDKRYICPLEGMRWVHKKSGTVIEGYHCGGMLWHKCKYCKQHTCLNHVVYNVPICHSCAVHDKRAHGEVCPKLVMLLEEIYGGTLTKAARAI